MKSKLMAAVAVLAVMTATGAARAQTTDEVTALKAQAAALKKQNDLLEQRLNKVEKQQASVVQNAGQPAPASFMAADLPSIKGLPSLCAPLTLDGPLTFCGITLFGKLDAGLGYASSGLPINGKFYQGSEFLNKYAHSSYFGINPNGLSNNTIGIKGAEEILPGWSVVFQASTFFNPQSGQLQNSQGSIVDQQGLNRNNFSNFGDGSRGGQAFNDQLFVGFANKQWGQLTFGRHTTLSNDLAAAYDPSGASNAFSLIGNSGTYVGGLGNSSSARWDDTLKYRIEYPFNSAFGGRFAAMYKFADGNGGSNVGNGFQTAANNECTAAGKPVVGCAAPGAGQIVPTYFSAKNDAGQIDLGASYGGFDIDGVVGYMHQAITSGQLSPAQLGGISTFTSNVFVKNAALSNTTFGNANSGTLSATASDIAGGAVAAKYTWNQFKFFAGWAHEVYQNPTNNVGIGADAAQGGYIVSSINNAAYPHAKLLDTVWVGAKYIYNPATEFTVSYYHVMQNSYGFAWNTPGVTNTASNSLATCSLPRYVNNVNGVTINGTKYAYQSAPRSVTCSGTLDAVSGYVDYHFNKRFDVYGGLTYSGVAGGIASNYYSVNNWAPTVGARFVF